jgi:hypothetical protein
LPDEQAAQVRETVRVMAYALAIIDHVERLRTLLAEKGADVRRVAAASVVVGAACCRLLSVGQAHYAKTLLDSGERQRRTKGANTRKEDEEIWKR